jgi:hypothetical protein
MRKTVFYHEVVRCGLNAPLWTEGLTKLKKYANIHRQNVLSKLGLSLLSFGYIYTK